MTNITTPFAGTETTAQTQTKLSAIANYWSGTSTALSGAGSWGVVRAILNNFANAANQINNLELASSFITKLNWLNDSDNMFAPLFSSGQQGLWYDPADLTTEFQDSIGTTPVTAAGDPVGLILDKHEGLVPGPELVTNGDFSGGSTDWLLGTGCTVASGQVTFTGSAINVTLVQTGRPSATYNALYKIEYTVISDTLNAGEFRIGALAGASYFSVANTLPRTVGTRTVYVFAKASGTATAFDFFVTSGATSGSLVVDNISVKLIPGNHAFQATPSARPIYQTSPDRLTLDKVDDHLDVTLPAITGTMVLATPEGTAAYGFNRGAGTYEIGGRTNGVYFPGTALVGQIIRDGAMSAEEITRTVTFWKAKGGGDDYGTVTNFTNFWRNWTEITSFPLIDTSSGTNFTFAWYNCSGLTSFPPLDTSSGTAFPSAWQNCTSLTSFPVIDTSAGTNFATAWSGCSSLTSFPALDTSAGTNFATTWFGCSGLTSFPFIDVSAGAIFQNAWRDCTSLTTFPANMFDTCTATNFINAFLNTNLNQTSIDNILVSIEAAGTSNGTFNQSGGSAPSATGLAAKTALEGRGWTVTVTP